MPRVLSISDALLGLSAGGAWIDTSTAMAAQPGKLTAAPPPGFEQLLSRRDVLLDAYFGGKMLGQVRATVEPGMVTFSDPASLAQLIPDVAQRAELATALSGALPANTALACGRVRREGCGILNSGDTGVVLDEDRFRIDVFVNPALLANPESAVPLYLAQPDSRPSLISLFSATLSGSSQGDQNWHFQNRSIAAIGPVRLRSDASVSSDIGLSVDSLALETDRKSWRYSGGIFWAPGTDLVGRRRIAGAGIGTQLDTRQDKLALEGIPIEVFLQQSAKVDVLIDGRVVFSRIYPAGNRLIDTESLPNGSYDIIIEIHEDGQPVREERRFFSKGSVMAPLGRPLLSAFAGFIPSSAHGVSVDTDNIFYQAAVAYRLSPALGVDATILGTQHKAILETGLIHHSRLAQFRAAGLISSAADYGIILTAATVGGGPVSLSFDLRKVKSQDGRPLLPVTGSSGSFNGEPNVRLGDLGSFTQALSILGVRWGEAIIRLSGIYRKNAEQKANYGIGASIEYAVIRSARWDLRLLADARKTERDFASFIGARILANRKGLAFSGTGGVRHQSDRPGDQERLVGEAQLGWSRQTQDLSQLHADGTIGRDTEGSYARGSAYARLPSLNARADVYRRLGEHGAMQYAATVDGALAFTGGHLAIAGRTLNDSGLILALDGGDPAQHFDIIVDEVVRGSVSGTGDTMLFLQPYESYDVRIRPRDSQVASLDLAPRTVTLYPGNVAVLGWDITPLFILFGRAVGADGRPIADADIRGTYGIGRTDGQGYFQIETNRTDRLKFSNQSGQACEAVAPEEKSKDGYMAAGDLLCR